MKNIKLNSKRLFAILLSGFILIGSVGCTNKKTNDNYPGENPNITENNEQTNNDKETIIDNNIKENEELTTNDKQVISYFDELKVSVNEVLNSDTTENIKDSLKGTFITVVDFIFYDGEIKGIKFDELTEGAKQNILETATTIDNSIMTKFPNYKEEISSTVSIAYNKASELIRKGASNIKEFSKEKLGEDNYNAIIDAKDELVDYTKNALGIVGDLASSLWDKGTEKVKNWYENFKNN